MKEKCEKLFHMLELIKAIILVFFVAVTVAIFIICMVLFTSQGKPVFLIPVAVFLILCDLLALFDFINYKKSAFYAERNGDKIDFYITGETVSKDISDCTKLVNAFYDRFIFTFNDEKIRLRRFPGCPEATEWIKKDEFPNI